MRLICLVTTLMCLSASAARAQERTPESYEIEAGAKYVVMSEEGGYTGAPGFLVEGGFEVWTWRTWRVQAIGEFMVIKFDDFDAIYKQVAGGVRMARQLTPKIRAFGQFQIGAQNDGFENSNTAFVVMPGGGVNYALTDRLDLQAMLDVPFAIYENATFNQVRFGIGVAFPLGGN
jgi:hypothetical protein